MKSKVAKLKAVDAWRPTRDDPLSGRWRKSSQRCSWRICPQMCRQRSGVSDLPSLGRSRKRSSEQRTRQTPQPAAMRRFF